MLYEVITKRKLISIDLPIAVGILAIFLRSLYEIISSTGIGYLDSLTGLVFFMLIGKWFQTKTYDALSFENDYTAYFPLGITRITSYNVCYTKLLRKRKSTTSSICL